MLSEMAVMHDEDGKLYYSEQLRLILTIILVYS